jgi:hypothetical protein
MQLYRLDVRSRDQSALKQLTSHPNEIVYFAFAGNTFLFEDREPPREVPAQYPWRRWRRVA